MSSSGENKPPTSVADARDLLFRLYPQVAVNVSAIKELVSYDDRNYLLKDAESCQPAYVLKVTNSEDSALEGMLEGQNEMMLHLASHHPQLKASRPLFNVHGQHISRETFAKKSNAEEKKKLFAVRLLDFVPGRRLFDFPITASLLAKSGDLLGRLQAAINDGGYSSEAIRTRATGLWSLVAVPQLRDYLDVFEESIEGKEKAAWVQSAIEDFEVEVLARMDDLPKAYIHGDFNEQNILVEDDKGEELAVIDFGDISYNPRVFDIAIAILYLMLLQPASDDFDLVLDGPRHVLTSFLKHVPLSAQELRLLFPCARARLAQSLTLGAVSYRSQPGNEYLLTTQTAGWKVMRRLAGQRDCQQALLDRWMKPPTESAE